MGDRDREYGVVDPDEVPLPDVAPETGIEPDAEAEAERDRTWGKGAEAKKAAPGADTAGGA
jgi:hypothetical protein